MVEKIVRGTTTAYVSYKIYDRTNNQQIIEITTDTMTGVSTTATKYRVPATGESSSGTIPAGHGIYRVITISADTNINFGWDGSPTGNTSLTLPTSNIPENVIFLVFLAPAIPLISGKLYGRKTFKKF